VLKEFLGIVSLSNTQFYSLATNWFKFAALTLTYRSGDDGFQDGVIAGAISSLNDGFMDESAEFIHLDFSKIRTNLSILSRESHCQRQSEVLKFF
jgi:hypothetical protein